MEVKPDFWPEQTGSYFDWLRTLPDINLVLMNECEDDLGFSFMALIGTKPFLRRNPTLLENDDATIAWERRGRLHSGMAA